MKPHHTQMEFEGDLFSGLEEPEAVQPEVKLYDKIIESRKTPLLQPSRLKVRMRFKWWKETKLLSRNQLPKSNPESNIMPIPSKK